MSRYFILFTFILSGWAWGDVQPSSVIQDLIDAAQPGDEVIIPAGEYHGSIVIRNGVIVRGEGDKVTVLDGQGASEVVILGKESAIIGFTIRNGQILAASKGHFIGIAECTLESYNAYGVMFQGGAGILAHNRLAGSQGKTGILCASANPLIVNNLIEGNQTGVQVTPHLIPTIIENLFIDNVVAIAMPGEAQAVIQRNIFDRNGRDTTLPELPAGNHTGPVQPGDFILQRGATTDAYRTLMRETYGIAAKDHPTVIYDLHATPGSFDTIGLFPWANFVLSSSTLDTRIATYQAYDIVKDAAINAEFFMQNEQRPSVRVHNPGLLEKMRERYVLENHYIHPPSYFEEAGGRRVFKRHTNVSNIEVVIPDGYQLVSSSPEGQLHGGSERSYLVIQDVGDTHLEVIMEPVAVR